ncbi:MAG: hypothetical protein ABIT01_17595 [Thermoanaerobaculia bacterium]
MRFLSWVLAAFLLFALGPDCSAATLPPHRPLRILVVGDDVNPHALPPAQLTEVNDLYLAIATPGNGLTIDPSANSVRLVGTNQIETATALLTVPFDDPTAYDVVVYFSHRLPDNGTLSDDTTRQNAFTAAVQSFLQAGGGFVAFHHGSYFASGKESILDLIGATANGSVPWDTTNGQNVIAVAPSHFVTTNGLSYSTTVAYSDVPRGVPAGTYPYFNNTPDERYPSFAVNGTAGELRVLFGSNYSDNGTTHLLGFTHRRPGWRGVVVGYQPAEYQPNALDLDGRNFQILANAIVYAANGLVDQPRLFVPLTPCRILDTRTTAAPALVAGSTRAFPITGACAIPLSARAVSLNATVTGSTQAGSLSLFPGGTLIPVSTTLEYATGQTRANNVVIGLGSLGDLSVRSLQAAGTTEFILDVNGYFE